MLFNDELPATLMAVARYEGTMNLRFSALGWRCRCSNQHGLLACPVPPSPDVMAATFMEYRRSGKADKMSFRQYLVEIGFTDPSVDVIGMDDAAQFVPTPGGPQLLAVPAQPVVGTANDKALLVHFSDRPGVPPPSHFPD